MNEEEEATNQGGRDDSYSLTRLVQSDVRFGYNTDRR